VRAPARRARRGPPPPCVPLTSPPPLPRLAGFDNFEQCRYLNETPLPLPWDQLITVVLIVWQLTVPVVTVASTINKPLGCALSVTIVWMLWALNEVARDVEDPFYNEPNDM
jgi:predicted membrane chloride channel (bestrophin family)